MVAEINLAFIDCFYNCYTETIEVSVDDTTPAEKVDVIVNDAATDWFWTTGRKVFQKMYPYLKNDEKELAFQNYMGRAKYYTDLE